MILKMEVACSSGTLVSICRSTWCHKVEDHSLKYIQVLTVGEFGVSLEAT
jgi:hypothetical protein